VADLLGFPFAVLDFRRQFQAVLDYFADEYARGRTPNPCSRCNAWIKFGKLAEYADQAGAAFVATGHHARIVSADRAPAVFRARQRAKDQSYALLALPRAVLARVLLPIGELEGKQQVRQIARELGLPVSEKAESQDMCFAPDGNYAMLLRELAPRAMRPGDIVDQAGRKVGGHEGIGNFTIGQRKGLRVAAGVPMYVIAIDAEAATVTIGPREATLGRRLIAGQANWHADPFDGGLGRLPGAAGQATSSASRRLVQVRYNHVAQPATVRPLGAERFEAVFDEPVHAITPGQVAAVYDGDRLLGGGWIESGQ